MGYPYRMDDPPAAADLDVLTLGAGPPVVLVHGSIVDARRTWRHQLVLAEHWRLLLVNRPGFGGSPPLPRGDFEAEAPLVAELLGDGAHLVGHSYGGLGAMLAAAHRPEATLSLTLLEAPVGVPADPDPAWQTLRDEIRDLWGQDLPDQEWVVQFLRAVGSDPDQFPPEMLELAVPLVPVFRHGRPFVDFEPPVSALAAARFPKLVVSGGHSAAFEGMCTVLARHIGAERAAIEGGGHEIQFTGQPLNQALLSLWRRSTLTTGS
jgi:pimeloyl-ACP methyl ester carboxylesterase